MFFIAVIPRYPECYSRRFPIVCMSGNAKPDRHWGIFPIEVWDSKSLRLGGLADMTD